MWKASSISSKCRRHVVLVSSSSQQKILPSSRGLLGSIFNWNDERRQLYFQRHHNNNNNNGSTKSFRRTMSSSTSEGEWICNRKTGIVSRKIENNEESLFQTVIGMEIHAQLSIPTKLFSSAPTPHFFNSNSNSNSGDNDDGASRPISTSTSNNSNSSMIEPNTAVWPLDVAVPGVLPRVSEEAVKAAVLTAAACQCEIPNESRFERKHYAYADLPLGYQVTQQRWPLATNGVLQCRRVLPGAETANANPNQQKQQKGGKKARRRGQQQQQQEQTKEMDELSSNSSEAQPVSPEEKFFSVGIDRIQLEQDTGKTTTVKRRMLGEDRHEYSVTESMVDFNRAGSALVEIVFRPDVRSADEAASVVSTLRALLKHIGTCDGKMEEGSLRCDLNVSIAPISGTSSATGDKSGTGGSVTVDTDNPFQSYLPPGTGNRVEVKNLNSIKQVIASAEYEAIRQAKSFVNGTPTTRETRTFDPMIGHTVTIRSKEGAVDYRFMPEPDIPPIVLNEETLDGKSLEHYVTDSLPELPEVATSRLMEQYGLPEDIALVITGDPPALSMYELAVETALNSIEESSASLPRGSDSLGQNQQKIPLMCANWLCNDLFGLVKKNATFVDYGTDDINPISIQFSPVNGRQLGLLIALILDGTVSTTVGKKILSILFQEESSPELTPRDIAEEKGWKMISDPSEVRKICEGVIFDVQHQSQLEQYKKGGRNIWKMKKFFIGKAMKESRGNAHPEILKDTIQIVLEEVAPDANTST